jgi:hypothetical protein
VAHADQIVLKNIEQSLGSLSAPLDHNYRNCQPIGVQCNTQLWPIAVTPHAPVNAVVAAGITAGAKTAKLLTPFTQQLLNVHT